MWGDRLPFGTICGEFSSPNGGWVHDVAFSPSGDVLAFVAHDASISIVYPSGPGEPPQALHSIRLPNLPYLSLTFTSESSLIAAGHDCQPILFAGSASGWSMEQSLDDPSSSTRSPGMGSSPRVPSGGPGRLNNEAFNMFRSADSRGQTKSASSSNAPTSAGMTPVGADGLLMTVHQNSITLVQPYEWSKSGEVTKVCTAGKDGRLVLWPVGELVSKMHGLKM